MKKKFALLFLFLIFSLALLVSDSLSYTSLFSAKNFSNEFDRTQEKILDEKSVRWKLLGSVEIVNGTASEIGFQQ